SSVQDLSAAAGAGDLQSRAGHGTASRQRFSDWWRDTGVTSWITKGHSVPVMLPSPHISRRFFLSASAAFLQISCMPLIRVPALAQGADNLPSWNDGPAKQAILEFVRSTVNQS